MVASANGVVAWRRRDAKDDPVLAILGGDRTHPARVADKLHMRYLRCFGDVSVGAETVRTQPELVLSPQQPSDEPLPELFAFREHAALPRQPRNIVYSIHGRLPMTHRIFTTPGIHPVVMTTAEGGAEVRRRAGAAVPPALVISTRPACAGPTHGCSRSSACATSTARAGRRCCDPCTRHTCSTRSS
jgi:hypothetical protein